MNIVEVLDRISANTFVLDGLVVAVRGKRGVGEGLIDVLLVQPKCDKGLSRKMLIIGMGTEGNCWIECVLDIAHEEASPGSLR